MPLTYGCTEEERAAGGASGIRWSNGRGLRWPQWSVAVSELLLEEGNYIAANPALLELMKDELGYQASHSHVIGDRDPSLSSAEIAVIGARWVLCDLYVACLLQWRKEVKATIHNAALFVRKNRGCQDVPELPKTGWEIRDRLEQALGELRTYTHALPAHWPERGPLPSEMVEAIFGVGSESESESEPEPESESESESEAEFDLVIRPPPPIGDVFPGADDEWRESSDEEDVGTYGEHEGGSPDRPDQGASDDESDSDIDDGLEALLRGLGGVVSESEESEEESEEENEENEENEEETEEEEGTEEEETEEEGTEEEETEEESEEDNEETEEWDMPNAEGPASGFVDGVFFTSL